MKVGWLAVPWHSINHRSHGCHQYLTAKYPFNRMQMECACLRCIDAQSVQSRRQWNLFFAEGQSGGGRTVKCGHQLVKDDDDPSSV